MTPQISIIIPTWNTAAVTKKCVDTILKYLPVNYAQIIIVDNGSTDNTSAVFSKLKKLVYLKNSTNLGFSKANNLGAQKAAAKYLFFLNSDIELIDASLIRMVNYLDSHPDIGLIGPQFLNPDLTPQVSVFPSQSAVNAFKEFWLGQKAYTKYTPNTSLPTKVWAVSGGAVLIRKELFRQVGGWDEKYFMYYEDLALCRELRHIGKEIYYYPEVKLIHRHGTSGQKIVDSANQWRRLIPSAKLYFGPLRYHLIFFITWSSQKYHALFTK